MDLGPPSRCTVAVIGAGMSGLSCAHALRTKHGLEDVTVLEARGRIGGRVCTVFPGEGNSPLELGAQWLHGGEGTGHSVFEFAKRFDLLGPRLNLVTNENEPEAMSLEMRRSDGSCLDREAIAVANRAYAGEGGIFPEAEALFHERDKWKEWKGRSLEEFFNKKADIAMEAAEAEGKSESFLTDLRSAFNARRRTMETYVGSGLESIGVRLLGSSEEMEGDDVAVDEAPRGMGGIVEALAEQLGKEKVHLNCEAKEVALAGDSVVLTYRRKGTEELLSLEAQFVVCTIPLGVLKAKHETLFRNPPLPQEKVRAIDNIGSGSMSKIFLRYTEPFWKTVPFLLTLSWTDKELREASANDWSKGVLDFASFDSHEDMLICWLAGSHAKTADSKTDKEVLKVLGNLIRTFSGDPDIPMPVEVIRQAWMSDPLTLGVYCTPKPEADDGDFLTLSQPLPSEEEPKILFAGEATEPENWSNLHGSKLSGLREAERIRKALGK